MNGYMLAATMVTKIKNSLLTFAQKIAVATVSPTEKQARAMLLLIGITLLILGLSVDGTTQQLATTSYNDNRISNPVNTVMLFLEGSFGALIMAGAGTGCILAAVAKRYAAALLLLVLAVGAFLTRTFIGIFFNDQGFDE
jgi:hypothetical protein